MHRRLEVSDFKVEVEETKTLDAIRISIELRGTADADQTARSLAAAVKETFELSPQIDLLRPGTLEQEFQNQVKQQRFIDKRG